MTKPIALVTGILGQDGSYLAELLAGKGYEVHGIDNRSQGRRQLRGIHFHQVDLLDSDSVRQVIRASDPQEIYNLAAAAFVPESFTKPELVREINAEAVRRLLDVIRRDVPTARFYQASSSEMFGDATPPQSEETPFCPLSPYAESKVAAHETVSQFRQEHEIHCSCGIAFNHESPRRSPNYVTRKVTLGVAKIALGESNSLRLGNLDAKRDWGYAPDYVRLMPLMMQESEPGDYVLATGASHSVREMAEMAFEYVDLRLDDYLVIDPDLFRATDPPDLRGDATKARSKFGWRPSKNLRELIGLMVRADLEQLGGKTGPSGSWLGA